MRTKNGMDLRHKGDQVPPTNNALAEFTYALEVIGCNPAILPLLTKLYGKLESIKWKCEQGDY
jgi:hypothetical protein